MLNVGTIEEGFVLTYKGWKKALLFIIIYKDKLDCTVALIKWPKYKMGKKDIKSRVCINKLD